MFGIGTRVKFLTTPDSGIITDKLGDNMVMVMLDGYNMEIPAFEEDLLREDNIMASSNPQIGLISSKHPLSIKPKKAEILPEKIEITPTRSGISVAFEAVKKPSGEVEKLDILLLNDTHHDILFQFDFVIQGKKIFSKEGKITAFQFEKMGEIPFDGINDLPEADIVLSPIFTEGVGDEIYKTLKIKPQQFIKNLQLSKFINRNVHLFLILDKFNATEKPVESDLKKYTQQIVKEIKIEKKKQDDGLKIFDPIADVNEYASFVPEIDLHIELLHDNPASLTNAEIVTIQIRAFDHFLSKAIRLGVPRVFAIHGVGKGRLRDMIHAQLRRHPHIRKFKNEYHERYGWGATEITFT